MSLQDLVHDVQRWTTPWRKWRRNPRVREHLRRYKRAWRAAKRAEGKCPT